MMKRICKFRYKLIILLLILSILLGEFAIRPVSVKAVDAITYTYWDLWYSIAGAQKASMSAKEGPFDGYDAAKLKDRAKVQFDNFKTWLQRAYVPVGITADMLVNQADEMIAHAKTTGLEMSQELWDAFRQYFDDVANDVPYGEPAIENYDSASLRQYISAATGGVVPVDFNCSESDLSKFFNNTNIIVKIRYIPTNVFHYGILSPVSKDATFFNTSWSASNGDGYLGWKIKNSSGYWDGASYLLGFSPGQYHTATYLFNSFYYMDKDHDVQILAQDGNIIKGTTGQIFSPFIDYTVSQGCPVEVPETIPWRVYPKEETDDDTKIIPFPVEIPDEGTTEVPGEETTEKPNPDEDPDNDNEEENDPFPGIFPWFPSVPEIPEYKPWVPDPDDDDPEPEPDPDPDPPPPPKDDDPEPEPDPDPDPPPPPGKVESYLNKLKKKFPFCIPFDMVTLFKNLKKTQKAPKWTFSYTFHFGDKPYTWIIVVDMADYDKYIQIFREGFFVLFLVGLFFATRKLISWQID